MCLMNFSTCAQDIIKLRSGEMIYATIIELTTLNVRYRRTDEPDGPIRNVEFTKVEMIAYENGSTERFVLVENKEVAYERKSKERPSYPKRRGPDRIPIDKDRILEGGLFVDMLPGYATNSSFSTSLMGLGARLGRKWYFGKNVKRRHGLQVTFVRFNLYPINDEQHFTYKVPGVFSPLGIGSTNAFKIKDKRGVEVNASVAPVILNVSVNHPSSSKVSAMYGVEVKYRHHRFAIGLDISRAYLHNSNNLNMLSLTTGFKF